MPDGYLEIAPTLLLPLTELEYRATRSGGPGGQHVNTSSTRIEVWWDVRSSPTLTDEQRALLLERLFSRLDGDGRLRVVASESRSQLRNREAATERLRELDIPIMLGVPDPDPMVERAEYARMREFVRDLTYVEFNGASHSMTAEIPDACALAYAEFLAKVEGR